MKSPAATKGGITSDNDGNGRTEVEVTVMPRETWEDVKGLLEVFEELLQEAREISKKIRTRTLTA